MKSKQEIRTEIREKKRQMSKEEITNLSKMVFERLEQTSAFLENDTIYTYVSYNQEVDTKTWMEHLFQIGKKVAVPNVIGEDMKFYYISSKEQLVSGYQGILEPVTTECADGAPGLFLMPGLAFDYSMHRCGYGGGFYDRYLKKYVDVSLKKVAVAYSFQIYEQIPVEEHDEKVDLLVSEKELFERKES